MDWDSLRVVLAIRDGGSLLAAAQALGWDRATVVRRLDGLETRLGTRLFDRRHDGCLLTQAGEEIISTIEGIAGAVTSLERRVAGADRAPRGVVKVAMPDFLAVKLVVPALGRLRERHPDIELEILTGYSVLNLVQGEAEIAMRNQRPTQQSLIARRLADGAIAFFASRGYLARRGTPDGTLAGHDVVLPYQQALALPLFGQAGEIAAAARCVLRADVMTALAAVRDGEALAVLPSAAVVGEPELVPVWPGVIARPELYLVTHAALKRQRRIRVVMDFLVAAVTAHEAEMSCRGAPVFDPLTPGFSGSVPAPP